MKRVLVAALIAFAGCDQAGTNPNTVDFSGQWHYTERMTDVPNDITCNSDGLYRLSQMGVTFSGDYVQTGLCRTPAGFVNNADSGGVANGVVLGRTIRFRSGLYCDYDGALDPGTGRIAGHSLCILVGGGDSITLNGTWTAQRP